MACYLRCLEGPQEGRELLVDPESPLQFELKRKGAPCGWVSFAVTSTGLKLVNDSEVDSEVNDKPCVDAIIVDGDRIRIGPMLFEAHMVSEDETDPGLPPMIKKNDNGDADARSARRISASRVSPVEESSSDAKSLFSKVGSVFKRSAREERPADLVVLEDRRDRLLTDVGRLCLEASGGFGLSTKIFSNILRGSEVTIGPGDIAASVLDTFQRNHELLKFLDAEILAKRREYGIEAETDRMTSPLPIREEREEREANAFQAMDGVGTEALPTGTGTSPIEIDEEYDAQVRAETQDLSPRSPQPSSSSQAGASQRRRVRRRRR